MESVREVSCYCYLAHISQHLTFVSQTSLECSVRVDAL